MPTRTIRLSIAADLLRAALVLGMTLSLSACLFSRASSEKGAALFRRERCMDCHGIGGVGGANGPEIADLQSNWTPETLTAFLADPEHYRTTDARLDELSIRHNSRMTPFSYLSESDRQSLALYLLEERP